MLESIQMFFESVINAEFDFAAIGEWFAGLWASFFASPFYMEIETLVEDLLSSAGIIVTAVLLVLSLIQVFAGKKLLGFQKFVAFLTMGFVCGVVFLAPVVDGALPDVIPAWATGLVVGVIAALLCKPLYFLTYVCAAAYSVYYICYAGMITEFTQENMIISLVAAVVAVVLVLVLRKWVEMLGTALLGAWCTYLCVDTLLGGFENMLGDSTEIVMWIAIGVIALIGFIVQVKTRRRY